MSIMKHKCWHDLDKYFIQKIMENDKDWLPKHYVTRLAEDPEGLLSNPKVFKGILKLLKNANTSKLSEDSFEYELIILSRGAKSIEDFCRLYAARFNELDEYKDGVEYFVKLVPEYHDYLMSRDIHYAKAFLAKEEEKLQKAKSLKNKNITQTNNTLPKGDKTMSDTTTTLPQPTTTQPTTKGNPMPTTTTTPTTTTQSNPQPQPTTKGNPMPKKQPTTTQPTAIMQKLPPKTVLDKALEEFDASIKTVNAYHEDMKVTAAAMKDSSQRLSFGIDKVKDAITTANQIAQKNEAVAVGMQEAGEELNKLYNSIQESNERLRKELSEAQDKVSDLEDKCHNRDRTVKNLEDQLDREESWTSWNNRTRGFTVGIATAATIAAAVSFFGKKKNATSSSEEAAGLEGDIDDLPEVIAFETAAGYSA